MGVLPYFSWCKQVDKRTFLFDVPESRYSETGLKHIYKLDFNFNIFIQLFFICLVSENMCVFLDMGNRVIKLEYYDQQLK